MWGPKKSCGERILFSFAPRSFSCGSHKHYGVLTVTDCWGLNSPFVFWFGAQQLILFSGLGLNDVQYATTSPPPPPPPQPDYFSAYPKRERKEKKTFRLAPTYPLLIVAREDRKGSAVVFVL